MLCDNNMYPNLNISMLVIDLVHTDIKISNNSKMNHIIIVRKRVAFLYFKAPTS